MGVRGNTYAFIKTFDIFFRNDNGAKEVRDLMHSHFKLLYSDANGTSPSDAASKALSGRKPPKAPKHVRRPKRVKTRPSAARRPSNPAGTAGTNGPERRRLETCPDAQSFRQALK